MEDQVRRMILEGGGMGRKLEDGANDTRPIVQLPTASPVYHSGHSERFANVPPHLRHRNYNVQTPAHDVPNISPNLAAYRNQGMLVLPSRPNMMEMTTEYVPPHHIQEQTRDTPLSSLSSGPNRQGSSSSQEQRPLPPYSRTAQRHGQRMQLPLDPNAFSRGGSTLQKGTFQHPRQAQRQLFDPASRTAQQSIFLGAHQGRSHSDQYVRQAEYLNEIANVEISMAEMTSVERNEKENFRVTLQNIISKLCEADPEHLPHVTLQCFGSFQSGFASRGSDMDLVIVSEAQNRDSTSFSLMKGDLPRTLEKKLLEMGYGARLLTRTRVPIIKICEQPPAELLANLREEREKWDALPDVKKYPHLYDDAAAEPVISMIKPRSATQAAFPGDVATTDVSSAKAPDAIALDVELAKSQIVYPTDAKTAGIQAAEKQAARQRRDQKWTRERKSGPLDFPKDGIGIQSDINFFNPLGLHNTQMLRNYSLCDPRVRSVILFVKAWAKRRKINSAYSGTLSSYGYVLMVLHYLINIVQPAVLPNLQSPWRPDPNCTPPGATRSEVDGWVVDFWQSEDEIMSALQQGQMSRNNETIGSLLVGFFSYFSSTGSGPQFHWMKDVLALRTSRGVISKEEKGWVKAVTEESEGRRVQQRYLFCIEDPFELSHNVSRTVTHHGIVAIRDEFRRAKRILMSVGNGMPSPEGGLMDALNEVDGQNTAVESHNIGRPQENQFSAPHPPSSAVKIPSQRVSHSQPGSEFSRKGCSIGLTQSMPHRSREGKGLDVMNDTAFPSLGGGGKLRVFADPPKQQSNSGASRGKKKQAVNKGRPGAHEDHNSSEISGDRAKELLAEIKRKNDEAATELVAKGTAEAVLGSDK
nr:terminal uridylyltransferase cid1 [Quercus suber]